MTEKEKIKGSSEKNNMTLFNLTWPLLIEILLFMMLGFIDTFMLSKYSDQAATAVGAANQIISMFNLVFTIISGATAVLVSQSLGANNRKMASKVTAISLTLNLFIGIICSFLMIYFREGILTFIGLDGKLLEYGEDYLLIVGGFLFVQSTFNTVTAVVRSHGNTRVSMQVTLVMNTINGFLDAIFVLGLFNMPVLGVKGVALATSFSRIIGICVMLYFLFNNYEKINIFKYLRPFPFNILKNILRIGIPSAFESINYNLSQLVITNMILTYLGSMAFTTKTYVGNIVMFFYIFSVAISQGNQILVGHLVGEGNYEKADKTCIRSLRTAVLLSLVMSSIGIVFRYKLILVFTDNSYIIALGAAIFIVDLFVEFGRAFNLVIISGLRGAGDTIFPVVMAIISMWGISVLFSYILGIKLGMGIKGMWIAFAADEGIRGVCMLIRWKSGKWKRMSFVSANGL